MKVLVLLGLMFSHSVFAQGIELNPGEVTVVSGTRVSCRGNAGGGSVAEAYARLPISHKINILKSVGIGSCYIRVVSGMNFFFSSRFVNGVHVGSSTQYIINDSLRNGECL